DHELARQLWDTGNHDARILATMIADPAQADTAMLEAWVNDLGNYVISDAISGFVSRTALAKEKMEEWTTSDDEWTGQVGWSLLVHLAMKDSTLTDDYFVPFLKIIESDIHDCKNRVRHSMNSALIAIGMRNDALKKKAKAVAEAIGEVYVDHGETNCKTPDALEYIEKAGQRQKQK
ncbi:MAG TPA: DNA alkylation repair protein, partial [Aggregatilineales bacterium]|nr:DNA alkylation repair protein [Aggregatilineales bacterium]